MPAAEEEEEEEGDGRPVRGGAVWVGHVLSSGGGGGGGGVGQLDRLDRLQAMQVDVGETVSFCCPPPSI